MQRDHLFKEYRVGPHDAIDGLSRHRVGREADEVARMAGAHRHTQLAVGFEPTNAWTLPGARINDHERPPLGVDRDPGRRLDAGEQIIGGSLERAAVENHLSVEAE